ncbi:heme exporter protein CcmD [Litorimonas taeanensis]|uniref:Heme exporter protein D n=1 Tax=Litorimonas taeanensis TaxID=568099 RepID=A0A420WJ77_9PROT|nr:heme exporter protein CcmD [Litorimonas taeanensis]
MFDYGSNTPFILAAYGISFLGLLTLIIWTLRKPKL